MKTILVTSLLMITLLLSAASRADGDDDDDKYECRDSFGLNPGFDIKNLKLVYPVGERGSYAKLKIPGHRRPKKLGCVVAAPTLADPTIAPVPLAYCDDLDEGGYVISLTFGGIAGATGATVFRKTRSGNEPIARLYCRSR